MSRHSIFIVQTRKEVMGTLIKRKHFHEPLVRLHVYIILKCFMNFVFRFRNN